MMCAMRHDVRDVRDEHDGYLVRDAGCGAMQHDE
jgi:hypothetical protein